MEHKSICPVCGQYGIDSEFDICDFCGWQFITDQLDFPDEEDGANGVTFNRAKELWNEKHIPHMFLDNKTYQ